MKHTLRIIALLFCLSSSCSFFPGFFQGTANSIVGIGGGWNHTAGFISPTDSQALYDFRAFDLGVSGNEDVFLTFVDTGSPSKINNYMRLKGQQFLELNSFPTNGNFSGTMFQRVSCSFDPASSISIPVLAYKETTQNYIYRFNNGSGWSNIQTLNMSQTFQLCQAHDKLAYISRIGTTLYIYTNYLFTTSTNTIVSNLTEIYASADLRNTIGNDWSVTLMMNAYIGPFVYDEMTHTLVNLPEYTNNVYLDPTNFNAIYAGGGSGKATNYYVFVENSGKPVVEKIDNGGTMRTLLYRLNDAITPVRSLTADYDYAARLIYLALADAQNTIKLYRFNPINQQLTQLGGNLGSLDPRYLRLKVKNRHVYLAVVRQNGFIEVWDYQD